MMSGMRTIAAVWGVVVLLAPLIWYLVSPVPMAGIEWNAWLNAPLPVAVEFTVFEQAVIVFAAFFIKSVSGVLGVVIVILLWKREEPWFAALKWGMVAFFLGENACTANYLFYNEKSLFFEFLHTYGMVLGFALVSYAAMAAVDAVTGYGSAHAKCALFAFCKRCYKNEPVGCTVRYFFLLAICGVFVLALIPISSPLEGTFQSGAIFGNDVIFAYPAVNSALDARFYPGVALVSGLIALVLLFFGRERAFYSAKVFFAASLGALGFSIARFALRNGFSGNLLRADAWEELTEFLFVAFVFLLVLKLRSRGYGRHEA